MGTAYRYSNLTKREWFWTDTLGGSAKLSGVGLNLTARAFDLLLISGCGSSNPHDPVEIGRWAGDAVAIIGDTDYDLDKYGIEFTDLTADVILLLHAHDGFDRIAAVAEEDDTLFLQLCHLAVTGQSPAIDQELRSRFPTSLWRRYNDLCRQHAGFKPKDVARPVAK